MMMRSKVQLVLGGFIMGQAVMAGILGLGWMAAVVGLLLGTANVITGWVYTDGRKWD